MKKILLSTLCLLCVLCLGTTAMAYPNQASLCPPRPPHLIPP